MINMHSLKLFKKLKTKLIRSKYTAIKVLIFISILTYFKKHGWIDASTLKYFSKRAKKGEDTKKLSKEMKENIKLEPITN